ncbi:DNA primase [Candidatus Gottesmanbacteria bacterium]|nr:DNA primase [Candidatus Gottesmanbacteria bacterium]
MGDIDEVKSRIDIVDFIGSRVKLSKAGRNFKGLCPFHSEKSPSFMVSPDRQVFHCFGCGKGGSAIDFLMELEHLEFSEALVELAEKTGVALEHKASTTESGKLKEQIYSANHLASEYYQYLLLSHTLGKVACEYLENRGVTDKIIKTFGIGYSPNSWDGVLSFLRKKGYDEKLLETAGLVVKSDRGGWYDRFRGRVMFTLRDHRGNVVGFSGRILEQNDNPLPHKSTEGQVQAKYINTNETPVYSKSSVLYALDLTRDAIAKAGEAVIMEGEFDVISSYQAGISNVVAIKGSALTEGHVHLLKRYTERIILCLDSDIAGDKASRRGIEIAEKAGFDIRVAQVEGGKDPDDVARSEPHILKNAIKDALPIYDYIMVSVAKRHDIQEAFGKKKASEEILPFLARIENPIVLGHYLKKASEFLGISESAMSEGLRRAVRNIARPETSADEGQAQKQIQGRDERVELYVLALLLQGKTLELYEELSEILSPQDFTNSAVKRLLEYLGDFIQSRMSQPFFLKEFLSLLPTELLPIADEALLYDTSSFAENEELCAREWMKALRQLRLLVLRRKIRFLNTTIQKRANEADTVVFDPTTESLRDDLNASITLLSVLEKSASG